MGDVKAGCEAVREPLQRTLSVEWAAHARDDSTGQKNDSNNWMERPGTVVPGCHAPGLRQSRARRAEVAPPLIHVLN